MHIKGKTKESRQAMTVMVNHHISTPLEWSVINYLGLAAGFGVEGGRGGLNQIFMYTTLPRHLMRQISGGKIP